MSINELGAALMARLIDAVQVNRSQPVVINGRSFWLKQRRFGRSLIIVYGNLFLKFSNSKIRMFAHTSDWQIWEVESYRLLYGAESEIVVVGSDSVRIPNVPGISLKCCLETHTLTAEIMRTAATEFSRAHSLTMLLLTEPWSHGDPHLENVLYDAQTHQAHLIDFETRHQAGLIAVERHADDLLVLLLDLLGRDSNNNWPELSRIFLLTYANRPVIECLSARLRMPRGLELVLWKTRTNHINTALLVERLFALKQITCDLLASSPIKAVEL
ncbi:MAG: hypothetical protein H0X30_11335 [Anaerolineae bacterium]|nr:hypothetical protein [Anaerolineae bacterium]